MSALGLFHVAIRTADLGATRAFYTRVLGMVEDPARPQMAFPGVWLRAPVAGSPAIIHVYAGQDAAGSDGAVPSGGAAVDHVSLTIAGFAALREQVRGLGRLVRPRGLPAVLGWLKLSVALRPAPSRASRA
ncbi:MAG: VOC family protein [Burkholderiales bacterium]|jgi:catechol 2,3-dioxygenase-like lactoylglutathione lyase family enzyme